MNLSFNIDVHLFITNKHQNMKTKYEIQLSRATDALEILESKMHEVRLFLKDNPDDAMHLKKMRELTLDMTITLNEIEGIQEYLNEINSN